MIPPRVHLPARRRGGGVADGGTRAAARANAAHRRAHELDGGRSECTVPHRGVPASHCRNADGWWVAMCGSNIAGVTAMPCADRRYAAELVALAPDVVWPTARRTWRPLQATRTVPIVFVNVVDPVGGGFVASLARPGGNSTGFIRVRHRRKMGRTAQADRAGRERVAILRDPRGPPGQANSARSKRWRHPWSGVDPDRQARRRRNRARITAFARRSNGGLVATASRRWRLHRELIIELAARHRLPAVYLLRYYVTAGGLISYGPDQSISTVARPDTSIASSRVRSPPTCRCRRRPNTNWSSI